MNLLRSKSDFLAVERCPVTAFWKVFGINRKRRARKSSMSNRGRSSSGWNACLSRRGPRVSSRVAPAKFFDLTFLNSKGDGFRSSRLVESFTRLVLGKPTRATNGVSSWLVRRAETVRVLMINLHIALTPPLSETPCLHQLSRSCFPRDAKRKAAHWAT